MKAKVPRLAELIDARVTIFRPLQVGDYGFIATDNGVMIGKGIHPLFPGLQCTENVLQLSPSRLSLEAKMANTVISLSRL